MDNMGETRLMPGNEQFIAVSMIKAIEGMESCYIATRQKTA